MTREIAVAGKEPWLAVILSSLFPGVGQLYAGRTTRGVVLIAITLILLAVGGWLFFSPTGSILASVQFLIGYLILSIFNLFDAHRCARKSNSSDFERARKSEKDPWLAVFLSRIIPGLGHAYQRQWLFAGLFVILLIGIGVLSIVVSAAAWLGTVLLYLCLYHVYISSPTQRTKSRRLILTICLVLLGVSLMTQLTAFTARQYVVETRYIPSEAMEPTLQVNDRFIIDKASYRFADPQRGDVVTFQPTEGMLEQNPDLNDTFIKRVIGLPNERVEIRGGTIYINNQALTEDYTAAAPDYELPADVIPEDAYFVLGDNRNNSYDSHIWGYVPRDLIDGKATKIFWPLRRSGPIQ
ncbi:MAG TPA: signal peptidase I [Trichocoleus sp.]